ncbi:hypothetical protein Tco_1336011, partial [Tanacetum coccineum]
MCRIIHKAYHAEYQDFNGGPVAFGGSKGYITSKVAGKLVSISEASIRSDLLFDDANG